jgi:hypothetical protein
MFSIDKDPSAKLDYVFDWTDWLHKTEVKEGAIKTCTVRVSDGIVLEDYSFSGNNIIAYISGGGEEGKTYRVECEITTTIGSNYLLTENIEACEISVPEGITLDSYSFLDGKVTAWISGGENGKTYRVSCKITTTEGRIDERSIFIKVKDR